MTRRYRPARRRRLAPRGAGTDLAGAVSHELRTPLAAIVGGLEVILDGDAGDLTAMLRGRLEAVDRNARRLHGVLDDLLFLVAPPAARPVQRRSVVLQVLADQALRQLCAYRPPVADSVKLHLPVEPVRLHGDPAELERMLLNLLSAGVVGASPGSLVTLTAGVERRRVRIGLRTADGPDQHEASPGGFELAVAGSIARRHGGALHTGASAGRAGTVTVMLPGGWG